MTSRRTIADLRALCNGYKTTARDGKEIVWLKVEWDDYERADRLKDHGWVTFVESDAGEGISAILSDAGEAIFEEWREAMRHGELEDRLDPEQGGVGEFCDTALSDMEEQENTDNDDSEDDQGDESESDDESVSSVAFPTTTVEDTIAALDDDYPSDTHGLDYPIHVRNE